MERPYSNSSLPQGLNKTAKNNLVKTTRSDGENNLLCSEDDLSMGDHDFKSKRRKTHALSKSAQELCFKDSSVVVPSTDSETKRKLSRVPSQDDLWKSIQTNYTFLMADDLITECQETKKELCLLIPQALCPKLSSSESPEIHDMLTFSEFLEHFNELHDSLHSLLTTPAQLSETKYEQLNHECQDLKEQAAILKLMNPELTDDINRRNVILRNKLQLLEDVLFPKRALEKDLVIKSLGIKMKEIRKWLQEVDTRLRRLKISDTSSADDMNKVFRQEKVLQREIESRGKELTSIVRQCESLEGATIADSKRIRRAAAHLERSWHNIWIRSLEKQCLTEQRLLQRQDTENNHQEASDLELDEGPLNKHRRLTLDRWTAVPNMDRIGRDRNTFKSSEIIKSGLTKDVGVICNDLIPVNDKCIMVGTTGIAALKAEYGDDFTNFEIIQDVGYSSESSTHLSSDDGINDRYFNIRVYNFPTKCTSLKEELEDADNGQQPQSLASSLGSSSGAASLNDSGIGTSELPSNSSEGSAGDKIDEKCVQDVFGSTDYLEAVLESCANFCSSDKEKGAKVNGAVEDLQYRLSGMDSDDSVDNFHNRSSFMTSSQLFYKMISVESENEDGETFPKEGFCMTTKPAVDFQSSNELQITNDASHLSETITENFTPTKPSPVQKNNDINSDSEQHSIGGVFDISLEDTKLKLSPSRPRPLEESDGERPPVQNTTPNLKRKRDTDPTYVAPTTWHGGGRVPHRVRSWLKRQTHYVDTVALSRAKRCLFRGEYSSSEDSVRSHRLLNVREDISSCDASGEYTSSSADEGNNVFSSSSFDEDDSRLKERLDSFEGSVETVLRGFSNNAQRRLSSEVDWIELSPMLPPPPMSSTPACLKSGQCKVDGGDHPRSSCGDMRWFVLKASSEGDLRSRMGHPTESEHTFSNTPSDATHKKGIFNSPNLEYKHRLCSSLPNVLRHRSDSSADDIKASYSESKSSNRHDDSFTTVVSHNLSSSSDLEKRKRRRNRRKSSSSNRSSGSALTSCDTSRHRTKTLTGSRRRHFSQKSDFFDDSENGFHSVCEGPLLEEMKTPIEEINHTNLKDELQLALAESCLNSVPLLSPAESDVVLTHLEEQSTVSDQVWDGYQDMPYLSEAYSEATVDEDAVRKLTEWDDYGSAIGQPLRFMDTANNKNDILKSPKKSSKAFLTVVHSNDSDSDLEDLHHVIEEAEKALHFARATLKRRQSGDFFSSTENAELLATCGTHLHCLQTICEFIKVDGHESNFSCNDLKELHNLIKEWKDLKKSIEMLEGVDDTVSQKYMKARKNIDVLFHKLSELSVITDMEIKDVSWEQLQEHVSILQMVLNTLQDTKEMLISVNLQVHRFVTEYGGIEEYKQCSLKDDVTELYQRWDDVYEKNGYQLTKYETLSSKWKTYSENYQLLKSKVDAIQHNFPYTEKYCDKNNISRKELCSTLEKDLIELKRNADFLQSSSIGASSCKSIQLDLKDLEQRIRRETRTLPASRNTNHHDSSVAEDDPDDDFEDALKLLDKDAHEKRFAKKDIAKKRSSRFWRIIRVAVPVQLTLVLLFCLACYLEPNCCDRMNNFSFAFTPHLNYWRGPPPV